MAALGVVIGLALLAAGGPSSVVDPAELRAFDAAATVRNYRVATQIYNRALDARIAARRTGDDPVISEMQARLSMRGDATAQTLIVVQQAAANAAPERQAALIFAQGQVAESIGRLADAERAYKQVTATSGPTADAARLALARRLMDHDLAGASALLDQLASSLDTDLRWEATLLQSRALANAGDRAGAQSRLDAAWSLVVATAKPALAAHRVARDRAIGAPRATQVALASFSPAAHGQISPLTPPACGGALRPDDSAIIEIVHRDGQTQFGIVRASRPEVASAFVIAVASNVSAFRDEVTTVALRCRHAISETGPRGNTDQEGVLAGWAAARGLYNDYILEAKNGDDAVDQERRHLEAVRAAYGADTVEAFATLWLRSQLELALAVKSGNPVYLSHARADLEEAARLATAAGAPAIGIASIESRAAAVPEDTATPPAQLVERNAALLRRMIDRPDLSTDALAGPFLAATRNRRLPLADRQALNDRIRAVLAVRHVAAIDPRAQAATVSKLALMQEAGAAGVPALAKAAAIDPGLCQATDVPPRIINGDAITSDDYPVDLTVAAIEGVERIEFDVDQTGRAVQPRVVFASPPELFDAVTQAGFAKLRFDPPRNGGKPIGCRATAQVIRWAMPDQDSDFEKIMERMSAR